MPLFGREAELKVLAELVDGPGDRSGVLLHGEAGIGKSVYSMRLRDVLMCRERYAELMPLTLPKTQLPPTLSEVS